MRPQLKHVAAGQPISAEMFNRLIDTVNSIASITAGNGINLSHTPAGVHLALSRSEKIWLFEITSSTPTVATGGGRYWTCDRMRLSSAPTWVQDNPTGYQVYDPVDDKNEDMIHLDGETVYARFNDDTGRWEMIWADCARRLGKSNAAINKGTGAANNVSIWAGTLGSESDTTIDVTAWNKFGNIATGKWVWVNHERNGWYITSAEC